MSLFFYRVDDIVAHYNQLSENTIFYVVSEE